VGGNREVLLNLKPNIDGTHSGQNGQFGKRPGEPRVMGAPPVQRKSHVWRNPFAALVALGRARRLRAPPCTAGRPGGRGRRYSFTPDCALGQAAAAQRHHTVVLTGKEARQPATGSDRELSVHTCSGAHPWDRVCQRRVPRRSLRRSGKTHRPTGTIRINSNDGYLDHRL